MKFAGGNLIYLSNDEYNKIKSLKEKKNDIPAPPIASKENKKEEKNKISNKNKITDEKNINIFTFQNESILTKIPLISDIPKRCEKCKSILNNYSKLTNIENNKYDWICEFCFNKNIIEIEKDLIPKSPIIEYCIEKVKQNEIKTYNERSIIFCLDISGSMSEYFNNNYSRLNIVKAMIIKNITEINKNNPNYKVGLVTFGSIIYYYGDGECNIFINEIDDEEKLKQYGNEYKNILSKPIKNSHKNLISKISKLKEEGCTALGPSILFSLSLLMNNNNGGRIFLCTDGLANEGVGSFNNLNESIKFYKKIGEMAKISEVCINLITFSESESNIQILINMVQETGGEIIQLNPNDNFDDIETFLNNDIIASKVQLEIKLNQMLEFSNQDKTYLENDSSCFKKFIGNIKKNMNLYFKFNFKSLSKISLIEDINLDNLNQIPFQIIIEYKDLNGNKYIRIYTELKSICNDLEQILKIADFEIISAYTIQNTAKLLLEGKYKEVEKTSSEYEKFLRDNQNINISSKTNFERASKTINVMSNFSAQLNNTNDNVISDLIMTRSYKFSSQPMGNYKDYAAPNINKRVDVFNQLNYNNFKLREPILKPSTFPIKSNISLEFNKKNQYNKVKNKKNEPIVEKNNVKLKKSNILQSMNNTMFNKFNYKQSNNQLNKKLTSSQTVKNNKIDFNKVIKMFDNPISTIKRPYSQRKKK